MTWRIPRHIAWVDPADNTPDTAWVLDAKSGQIFGISPAALAIWMACDEAESVEAVVSDLVEHNGWERADVAQPTSQFIRLLLEQGFLEEGP